MINAPITHPHIVMAIRPSADDSHELCCSLDNAINDSGNSKLLEAMKTEAAKTLDNNEAKSRDNVGSILTELIRCLKADMQP